jgi:hypothetical protein
MSDMGRRTPPGWYWIVAALALIWEAVGCYFYLVQVRMTHNDLAALPKAQADAFASMNIFQWSAFAIAVWIGAVGALLLLLRSRWAQPALLVSLLAAILQYGYTFFATPFLQTMSLAEALPLPLSIIVVGILLVWFAGMARKRGWIG